MSKPENPRAFPSAAIDDKFGGMTLRDWFAGQALAGIGTWMPAGTSLNNTDTMEARAWWAYRQADALLAQREKPHD